MVEKWRQTSENGKEVVFEVLYHQLGFISPVHVRQHKLELSLPQLCDDWLEVCAGLISSLILRSTESPRAANRAMMMLKSGMRCLSAFIWNACCGMRFPSMWYAIITYWLPKRACLGNCLVSSVYSLLIG
jgi:hypothetical protein